MEKDIDDLRREQEHDHEVEASLDLNPVKRAIQELFHNEFSGEKYRKYKLPAARKLVIERLQSLEATGAHGAAVARLTKKASRVNSVENLLLMLNEYLFT